MKEEIDIKIEETDDGRFIIRAKYTDENGGIITDSSIHDSLESAKNEWEVIRNHDY